MNVFALTEVMVENRERQRQLLKDFLVVVWKRADCFPYIQTHIKCIQVEIITKIYKNEIKKVEIVFTITFRKGNQNNSFSLFLLLF